MFEFLFIGLPFLLLLLMFKIFKGLIGCSMIIVGLLLFLILIPFIPILVPVFFIFIFISMIVGGIKLIFS